MRALTLAVGVLTAAVLWFFGAVFDLNGAQWDWWRNGAYACAWLALALAVGTAIKARGGRGRPRPRHVLGLAVGSTAVAASAVVMAWRYSDPYAGPLLWPHALACVAAAGVAVVLVYACAAILPR